jgi:membrane protease YdiL (CAAX protease family)
MNLFAETSPADLLGPAVILLLFVGCAAAWTLIAVRWFGRQPVLPYEPRRPVPWRTADVALILVVYLLSPALVFQAWSSRSGAAASQDQKPAAGPSKAAAREAAFGRLSQSGKMPPLPIAERGEPSTEHPLGRLLEKSKSRLAILLVVVMATVIAPVVEELLLRLTFQGWLEAAERRWRRRRAWLRRCLPGVMPIALVSLCFAALHIRAATTAEELPSVASIAARAIGDLATIGVILLWLPLGTGATLRDLGIVPGLWRKDIAIGLVAFAAVTGPILVFNAAISPLAKDVVLDPVPIFLLAIVLGALYYRTHRILPSIVLHASFNATSVLLALAARCQ